MEVLARSTLKRVHQIQDEAALAAVIDFVEREFRLEPGKLQSRAKTQRVALARQISYFLCRAITSCSFPVIGDAHGRDHSSIVYGVQLIERRMARDAAFRRSIEKLERQAQLDRAIPATAAAA
jgi:chromosomal replication initiator protein